MIISKGMVLGVPWPDFAPVEAPTLAAEPSYWYPERSCSPFLRESINALLRTLAARDPTPVSTQPE